MTITLLAPDGVAVTAQQERQARAALHGGGSGRPLGGRSGFRVGTLASVLSVTSTTVTLGPCAAMIDPGASTHQGVYGWSSDSNISLGITAADATYDRKDIVYIQVNDSSAGDGSGATSAPVLYAAGTPASSPVAPDLPARSFLVGTITVPKVGGGSPSAVLNPARYVAAGGLLPISSQAELDALTPYPGLTVYRTDLGLAQRYNGSKWYGGAGSIAYQGIYQNFGNGYANSFWSQTPDGLVTLNAMVGASSPTVTHVAGQIYTIGTVPTSIAPGGKLMFPGNIDSAQWSQPTLYIDATGTITYSTQSTTAAAFWFNIAATWRSA